MSELSENTTIYPPCAVGCPVHTDTRLLVELITRGEYNDALDLLLNANPFSSVCGRICHHPCEQNCRRAKVDAPLGLMKLKRFIMENAREYRVTARREKERASEKRKERIAIVGSGPSGMTAAHDLAKMGFGVKVFERSDTPGGLLGTVLPRYRLPYEMVKEDIDDILALGVELETGVEIGKDVTIKDMMNDGYSAVLLATGLSESRSLAIPGIDSDGILLALPFLRSLTSAKLPEIGKRVIVIGGGNVAIDVARSAKRLGSEKITMVCLESEEEMPAWDWEREEAADEGISIMYSWGPHSVFSEDNRVRGMEFKKCVRVFDDEKRFNPVFDESNISTVPADNVIISIGQYGDLTCTNGSNGDLVDRNRLKCDQFTLSTSMKGVFGCGEVLIGPGSSVEAVRDGHRAAKAIAHYLNIGELLQQPLTGLKALGELPDDTVEKVKKQNRVVTELIAPETRIKNFVEIERGFTEAEALAEAKRCISCTTGALADESKCAACLTCVRVCPFGVATVDKTAIMPEEKCQACGLCAAQCPAAAIALKRFSFDQMREELIGAVSEIKKHKGIKPLVISYCCLFEVTSRDFIKGKSRNHIESGVYTLMVPCVARLSVHDILMPFELDADAVNIIACSEGSCLYPTAEERLLDRIRQAKDILDDLGLESERIDFWKTKGTAESSWTAFWEISRRKINQINKDMIGRKV
jgi:NADPH-dependent glutamate synthase beta subunit-like oxidoreductase/coenzyme F420-reducing hydrogenase delta subunit